MANQKRTIDYEIQFRTNQQSLQNVNKVFRQFFDNFKFSDLQLINNSTKDKATKDLLEIRETANTVEAALTAAFNPKLGITNIDTFKNNLKAAGTSIEQVRTAFDKAGGAGTQAFQAMANSLTNVRLKATESESIIDKMGETLKRTLTWSISSSIINKMAGSIQEAYGYVKHLDSSLNDIRIVTEYSADAMDKFAEKANKAAITLGKSTTDYTEAALIYYQQGLGEEDVAARTDVTLKTANVTQQSTAQVSEELTAIWNGYKVNAEEAEAYIDKVAKVAAVTAADLEEMATGMSKVASAANVMGVDIDQMNAILATTISVTRQAPESVGAAYKTIFARMSQIQAGEETDDGATLKSYTEQMAAMGVSVLDANDHLRDMGDIIEEVGGKWQTWSREQQIAFAQVAAGTRQYNNLIALFDNWGMYEKTLEESKNALGTLQTQQDIYMESTAAHLQQLRTAAEGVYDSLINAKDINSVVDVFTKWTKSIETIVDGLGGLKGVLGVIGPLIVNAFSSNLGQIMAQGFSNFTVKEENVEKIEYLKHALDELNKTAPETTKKYIEMKDALGKLGLNMNPEMFNKVSSSIEKQAMVASELQQTDAKLAQNKKALNDISSTAEKLDTQNEIHKLHLTEIQEAQNKAIEKQTELTEKLNQANIKETDTLAKQTNEIKRQQQLLANSQFANKNGVTLGVSKIKDNLPSLLNQNGKVDTKNVNQLSYDLQQAGLKYSASEIRADLNRSGGGEIAVAEKINKLIQERYSLLKDCLTATVETKKANKELADLQKKFPELTDEELELIAKKEQLEQEGKELLDNREKIQQRINELESENIILQKEAVGYIGRSIGQFASAVTSIISLVNQIQNIIDIWNDDSLDDAEKFKQIIAATAAAITTAGFAINGLTSGINSINTAVSTFATVERNVSAATTLSTAATGANTTATNANTTAVIANKVAREGLWLIIGALVIAIATYTAYVLSGAKAENELKKSVKDADEALKKQKETYQELSEEISHFKELTAAYIEQTKALEDMIEGTDEWNQKMKEVSSTVDELLEKYPELMQYGTYNYETGTYSFDPDQLEKFSQDKDKELLAGQMAVDKSNYELAAAKVEQFAYQVEKYGTKYQQELDNATQELINLRKKIANENIRYKYSDEEIEKMSPDEYQSVLFEENEAKNQYNTYEKSIQEIQDIFVEEWRKGLDRQYDYDENSQAWRDLTTEEQNKARENDYNNKLQNLLSKYEFLDDGTINRKGFYKAVYKTEDGTFTTDYNKKSQNDDTVYDSEFYEGKDNLSREEFLKDIEEIYGKAMADAMASAEVTSDIVKIKANLDQGLTSVNELTLKQINSLEDNYEEYKGTAEKIINKYKEQLNTTTEREAYDRIVSQFGDNANSLDLQNLSKNIAEAFSIDPEHGIQKLEAAIRERGGITATVNFDQQQVSDDLQQKLDDAKISLQEFEDKKKQLEAQSLYGVDDDTVIRFISSQKALNDVYKDRKDIFKSLSSFNDSFDWRIATDKQVKNARALADALGARFGKEVDFDFIIKHLDIIEKFLNGEADATRELNIELNQLSKINLGTSIQDINDKFSLYTPSAKDGQNINQQLQKGIDELAQSLELSDKAIESLYNEHGYRKTINGWIYDANLFLAMHSSYYEDQHEYILSLETQWQKVKDDYNGEKEDWANENGYQLDSFGNIIIPQKSQTIIENEVEVRNTVSDLLTKLAKENMPWYQAVVEIEKELKSKGLSYAEAYENGSVEVWKKTYLTMLDNKTFTSTEDENSGSTKALKQTVYTPKLDTSAEDREIKELNNKIKIVQDAQKDLSGDSLQTSIDKEIELENELYGAKLRKIEKEKEYRRELETSLQQNLNGQDALLGFEKDANGYITNIEDVEKAYVEAIRKAEKEVYDEENSSIKDESKLAEKRQTLEDLKEARSSLNSYAQSYNKSLETTNSLTEEEYQHLRKIQELTEKKAQAGAERSAATSKALADIEYQAEKTSKALDHLGEAGDLSGSVLVKYNEARIDLLKQEEDAAKKRTEILKQERDELLGSVNDSSETDSLYGNINRSGLNLDVSFRDDGSIDLEDLRVQYEKIQEKNKDNETYLTEIAGYWKTIEKYAERYNSNLDESNKAVEDWVKDEKEIARLSASMKYAEINAELEEAAKKAGIFKQNLEHAKAVFDKAGDNKKNFVKGYIQSLEEYDKVQEAVLKRSAERFEKLKQDWNPQSDTTALSAAFNAEDMESFMAVYGDAQLELIELDKELEKELAETQASMSKYVTAEEQQSKEYLDLVKKAEKLKQAQDQLEKSTDDLTDKYEYLSSKMADMSQVTDLSKEWKTAAVDREIKKVNRELSLLQKQQSRLKGKDVITNLQQQVAVIQKQIKLEQNKLKILQAQAQTQRVLIQEMITQMSLQGLGSAFDSSGHVNAAFLDKLAKKADLSNEKVQMLISALKDYESIMNEIESQQDAIVSLQDEIADKQYEISEKIYEEARKEAEKLLNKFKIEIEVELNEAEMMRKIDRLRAKVAAMPAWDLAGAMGLDIGDAVSYATKDVDILTNAVNKLITDYQSDAWKDFYDTQKDAYDDIISYANQLTSAVESFYDALDTARQKYSEAIDKVISANQELIDDLEEMKKISKHGINITKMLFGENSYEDLTTYYKKIQNTTREQLQAAKEQAAYYKALLATIDPMKHPDEYESVKSALKSAIDETYAYAEEMGNQALEEMNAKIEDAARKLKDEFARVQGYENSTMQDLAHDYQQKILNDYLDTTESQYEMVTLQNKFTKAINDTTSASEKSKLSKVMKEQVGYLQQQVEKTGRLTKYEVDRANMMYDLTLKQMALEEARDNKTKMRLRRDSQGNYRYEYVADAEKTAEAQQDLLEQQYKIYELDKKRLLELYDEKQKLIEEFNQKQIEILNNQYLTEVEKEQAVNELKEQYYGEDGYLIQLGRDYVEAVHNIDESADGELDKILEDIIEETGRTSEEIQNNFMDVANAMDDFADAGLAALNQYTTDVQDAIASLTDGLGNLEATVDMNINTIMELADVDLELIDVWMEQVDVCGDLMAQLEELEDHYRGVMQAALDAAEAAAKLKVTDFSTAETRKTEQEKKSTDSAGTVSPNGGSSSSMKKMLEAGKRLAEIMPYMYNIGATDTRPSKEMLLSPIPSGKATKALSNSASAVPAAATIDKVRDVEELLKKLKKVSFDTGGYTGEWGTDGRFAILHQKELVLNSKDTENFLKAADVMRTLQSNIEQIQNHANTMSPNFNISVPSSDLNQNVKIEASFPGVTNSREIEDAFNNLVNLASQRAMSTRR